MSALRTYLWTALIALVGCGSPLVGLECQDGLERCGNACFDLANSPLHCGGCNIACSAVQHCEQSMCVAGAPSDGGPGDDGSIDAGPNDGGALDASFPDGRIVGPDGETLKPDGQIVLDDGAVIGPDGQVVSDDGGADDGGGLDLDAMLPPPVLCTGPGSPLDCVCGIGLQKCGDTCVDINTDLANCGACGNLCPAQQFCNSGICDDRCDLPVTFCNGQCVDFRSDDANCGSCGFVCASTAQCIDSLCVGQVTGHVVAIGHDMTGVLRTAVRQIVANAVFLPARATVRVLVYDAATSIGSRVGVSTAIAAAAASIGRQYTVSTALPETVTAQLASADVFVIDPQQGSSDGELYTVGTGWSAALSDFLFRGGVVVLFDGNPSTGALNGGTWQVLRAATDTNSSAPILQVSGATLLSQRLLTNVRPGDAIGINVPTPYQSSGQTFGFTLESVLVNPHNIVIQDQTGTLGDLPVVIHGVFDQ
ncbi:MAG TPA: hypothetical protein VFX59_02780 [Polyangiales bacterium]|nr:hypothetical protein [Polyangiales bacterium]